MIRSRLCNLYRLSQQPRRACSSSSATPSEVSKKSKKTPLVDYITTTIKGRGPLSVSQFFREALANEKHGYYTTKPDVIGTAGDFITAPEISQVFGELIGIWSKMTKGQLGGHLQQSDSYRIVELGPGRGTLAVDMIRGILGKQKSNNAPKINLHLVETSPVLRQKQAQSLQCEPEVIDAMLSKDEMDLNLLKEGVETKQGLKVHWHSSLREDPIPGEDPVFFVAQEFFDALPVDILEYTEEGWREVLVDVDTSPEGPHHFRYALSPAPTVASRSVATNPKLALPKTYIPKVGNRVEISFERLAVVEQIATMLSKRNGAGLFIDYGQNFTPSGTVRAIKSHVFEDMLCEPGELDVTSDVDFSAFRRTIEGMEGNTLNVFGPVTQSGFLKEMGIHSRILQLLDSCNNDLQVESIISSYKRLTEKDQMGTIYKVLGVSTIPDLPGFSA